MAHTRIAQQQLASWRGELRQWTDRASFRTRMERIKASVPAQTFFHQGGLQFLRDAWIGSKVADARASCEVRLCPEERPDFETRTEGVIRQYESTEADIPGRRRGQEDWTTTRIEADPIDDWRKRFEAIEPAVSNVVRKKLAKKYDPKVSLVIYVNLGCYGAYVREGISTLVAATRPARDAFHEILVLWEDTLYSFWKDGKPNSEQWGDISKDDF